MIFVDKARLPWLLASGCLLLAVSLYGIMIGTRASAAHMIYRAAKFDIPSDGYSMIESMAARAHRLYPYNYYLCMLAAETAYLAGSRSQDEEEKSNLYIKARYWCDTGLELNFHKRELRFLKSRLLAMDSPGKAVEFWREYVDWQYWDAYNHYVLVEYLVKAGQSARAMDSLRVLMDTEYYGEAADLVYGDIIRKLRD